MVSVHLYMCLLSVDFKYKLNDVSNSIKIFFTWKEWKIFNIQYPWFLKFQYYFEWGLKGTFSYSKTSIIPPGINWMQMFKTLPHFSYYSKAVIRVKLPHEIITLSSFEMSEITCQTRTQSAVISLSPCSGNTWKLTSLGLKGRRHILLQRQRVLTST